MLSKNSISGQTLHKGIATYCLCDNRKRKYTLLGGWEVIEITEEFRGIVLYNSGKKVVTCRHALINYKDTKALAAFLQNLPAGKLSGINLPSKHTIVYSQRKWRRTCARHRNCCKKSLMIKDHHQLFICIVVYVYD